MGKYKISDLEKLSGIKAHTIRIWEQRYNILTPLRTETNIRYYDDFQLRKLLNVVSLINSGRKISAISKLSNDEVNDQIGEIINTNVSGIKEVALINELISAGLAYDEASFEKSFSHAILSFGLLDAYQKVFYPMINKIGFLWITSGFSPSQEHFISNLIKQKIFAAIDSLKPPSFNSEKWVLFLPEGEVHDMGLLIANYGLRSKGVKVVYLGANVPIDNLYEVAENIEATHYLTFIVKQNQVVEINDYLHEMKVKFNNPNVFICCDSSFEEKLNLSDKQLTLTSFEEFQNLIQ